MSEEIVLMKGNEAIAHAAIRYGTDGYFGYPITPQSEIMETLMAEAPWNTTGMVVLQAESEIASINMVYGGAGCGKAVMTSSSSPGMSLMLEGVSYLAGAELPCLLVNVMRGGPGLGTIQPSQADYFQTVKGGGHGDYNLITLAPASVQEMMEKVKLPEFKRRRTEKEIREQCPWATLGKPADRKPNVITSLELDPYKMEINNLRFQAKFKKIEKDVCLHQEVNCEDADYILVAFGSAARICQKAMEIARAQGIKVGLIRPITLWPFPSKEIDKYSTKVKGMLTVEMNAGQMVEDVRLAVNGKVKVEHYGRLGGIVPTPSEVVDALQNKFDC